MLSICILETDILRPELIGQYSGYGRMFERLFARQPVPARFSVFNVVRGEYPPDGQVFDAYLVTGSKADSFGSDAWIETLRGFLLRRHEEGAKLLGVCFGHQLLALLLGGRCGRAAKGWGVGVHRYRLEQTLPWMTPPAESFGLLVSHRDQVTALPEGAQLLASSEFCPVAAYRIGEQVLCFQGHPEFVEGYARGLLDLRREAYGEPLYQKAISTLNEGHDGALIAQWMLQFVQAAQSQ